MSRYRFARNWARTQIVLGVATMILFPVAGALFPIIAAGPQPQYLFGEGEPTFLTALAHTQAGLTIVSAAIGLCLGLLIGTPLVVLGQVVLVFLDQRRLLARIHAELKRSRSESEPAETGRPSFGERLGRRRGWE